MRRRRLALVAGGLGAAGALAWGAWATERTAAARLRASEAGIVEAGLAMPADVEHHFVTTSDGARLHVVAAGEGPPVLLVHGVTLSSAIFAPLLRELRTTNRVLCLDLRGHGASSTGEGALDFERQADDLAEVIDALGASGCTLVGHSMGGMIAQVLLARGRTALDGRVGRFVALDTSTGPLSTSAARKRFGQPLERLAGAALTRSSERGTSLFPGEDAAVWLTRASFGSTPGAAAVELARSQTQSMAPRTMAGLLGPLAAFDSRPLLESIDVPTTVVVGSRDLLTPPRQARRLAAGIPGADLVVIKGAGHMVMLEATEALADVIVAR
jgi:pimeloyl-ACP methyl ester carboxylesterase